MRHPKGTRTLSTANKALDVMESIAARQNGVRLTDLARDTGIPKSTLSRYLLTLERRNYISKDTSTGRYELGLKLFELGSAAVATHSVLEIALPVMRSLVDRFVETVSLGILDGGQVLYLEMLESPQAMRMSARVGSRHYAHSTSLGKAMLAFLPEEKLEEILWVHGLHAQTERTITTLEGLKEELKRVKERGYAIDEGENEPMARCVGAPILDRFGDVTAALSLAGPVHRFSDTKMTIMGQGLVAATSRISKRIGYSGG